MAQNQEASWYKLTPSGTGSYVDGTWTQLASMNDSRLYYASQVLKDGRVLVAGGEYGSGTNHAEVYDPLLNTWTETPPANVGFVDAISETLPNGNVMVAPVYDSSGNYNKSETVIYDIVANTWSVGPPTLFGQNEVPWVKLPGGGIIMPDSNNKTSERYIPSMNAWVSDGKLPVALYSNPRSLETGSGYLLPNGNVFFLGYMHTATYTPSGTDSPGTWVKGPDIPNHTNCGDSPGAMMANGVILCCTGTGLLKGITSFFEYDYTTSTFTPIDGPTGPTLNNVPYLNNFLDLPDGSVLLSNATSQLYQYGPSGAPLAAGKPAISGIVANGNGSFHLTGTLLNGISEGAAYGDDVQMATNYPIIRLTDGSNVYYARTFNWSSTGVMTGSTPVSTDFTLPPGLPTGSYSLVVAANGIASDPVTMSAPIDAAPTVATAASAIVDTMTGTTAQLSVLGADSDGGGEPNLTYTWSASLVPNGAITPSFSANGTNAAKNMTATFSAVGNYTLSVAITDASGLSVVSSVNVSIVDIVPVITSALTVNVPVNAFLFYIITTKNVGFSDITYSAQGLPDGLMFAGSGISGTPTTKGQYMVMISAMNKAGTDTETLTINVTDPSSYTLIDSDGDGFPDELETFLGTDPNDPNSTPFGGAPADPQSLTVNKLQIKLNFALSGSDSIMLTGQLPVPAGFSPAGKKITVDVGGYIQTYILNANGSTLDDRTFKSGIKTVKGVAPAQTASFTLNVTRGFLSGFFDDEGLVNVSLIQNVSIPVIVLFNEQFYTTTVTQSYTGVMDKSVFFSFGK